MDSEHAPDFIEFNPYEVDPPGRLSPPERTPPDQGFPWKYAIVLGLASIAGSVLLVPFSIDLLKQVKGQPQFVLDLMPVIMVIEVGIESVFSIAMIALGLGLGRSLGLVWPPLDGWDDTTDRAKRMRSALVVATASAIILAGIFVVQAHFMEGAAKGKIDIKLPPWWSCLIASVGAGVREEVWLRLGLMTFFAWVVTKIARRDTPGAGAIWFANVLASLVFGAIHLPQAFQLIGGGPAIVAYVMIGNGIPGIVFGWLFWRKGLIAAMVCHTVFDVVIKVILPLMTGG